jgi:hypothetical protein
MEIDMAMLILFASTIRIVHTVFVRLTGGTKRHQHRRDTMKILGKTKDGFIFGATTEEVYALLGSYLRDEGYSGNIRRVCDPWISPVLEVGTIIDPVKILTEARSMRKAKSELSLAPRTLRALADIIEREASVLSKDEGE